MSFFRPLSKSVPSYDPDLPWPLDGMAYVIMFCCPLMGAPAMGLTLLGFVGLLGGVAIAFPIWLANILMFDFYLDERLARLQKYSVRLPIRVATNILGFAWALAVSAMPVFAAMQILKWLMDVAP